jgi:AcrR family transcriptional regulator
MGVVDRTLDRAAVALAKNPAATMAEIAAEIGVSRATLHRRFPSRSDLILALSFDTLDSLDQMTDVVENSEAVGLAAVAALIAAVVALVPTRGFLAKEQMGLDHPAVARFDKILDRWELLVADAQRRGEVRIDLPARWIVMCFDGLATAAFHASWMGVFGPRELPRLVTQILLGGITNPSAVQPVTAKSAATKPASAKTTSPAAPPTPKSTHRRKS